MSVDVNTVTREDMDKMDRAQLATLMPALVNAYQKTHDPSRLELRNSFYDRAYGLDLITLPRSHAEYLDGLKSFGDLTPACKGPNPDMILVV